jgi:hypothetical protein
VAIDGATPCSVKYKTPLRGNQFFGYDSNYGQEAEIYDGPAQWRGQHGIYTSKKKRWEAEGYTYRNGMRQNPRYLTKRMMKPLRHGLRYKEGLPYHGTDQMKEYEGMTVSRRNR